MEQQLVYSSVVLQEQLQVAQAGLQRHVHSAIWPASSRTEFLDNEKKQESVRY